MKNIAIACLALIVATTAVFGVQVRKRGGDDGDSGFKPAANEEDAAQRNNAAQRELNSAFTHEPGGQQGEVNAENHAEAIILGNKGVDTAPAE